MICLRFCLLIITQIVIAFCNCVLNSTKDKPSEYGTCPSFVFAAAVHAGPAFRVSICYYELKCAIISIILCSGIVQRHYVEHVIIYD